MINDQEAMDFIIEGELEHLQTLAEMYDDFPNGRDSCFQRNWITHAIDCGSYEVVEWMLAQSVCLNFRDDEGFTPLHSAIDREQADKHQVLKLLCLAGADVNADGFNFWTPLHMAAARNDVESLRILLEHGADPKLETIDDHLTPLQVARVLKSRDALNFLAQST